LVAIVDVADPPPAHSWLDRFIDIPCDELVLLTGEGLRRLHGAAHRARLERSDSRLYRRGAAVAALVGIKTICRLLNLNFRTETSRPRTKA
jgi:hypothetical protein